MKQIPNVGVTDARSVDVVFDGGLGEVFEDLGGGSVTTRVGRSGETEDGGAGEGDGDAVAVS